MKEETTRTPLPQVWLVSSVDPLVPEVSNTRKCENKHIYLLSGNMKKSGIVWSEKHLFMYIKNPGKYVPGNRMSFAGIEGDQDRANLIAYLKTL